MTKRDIDDLVYILNEIKSDPSKPKPIVFIGAGASASAGIPLTGKIIEDILEKYKEKPSIKRIDKSKELNYYELMSALSADERRELFSSYINNDNVKLNVTHIFLAQLLLEGYVDYVFTPNFDDLLLKASMLFNKIPPVYDITHGNEFTTTNFQKQSITYLHGQHFGQWLLNSKGELDKTKNIVPSLFRMVCNQRTWIIIGYSGEDELLDEIAKFESFDNELYWVGYKQNEPNEKVKNKLLNAPNKNAYLISGYDSDTFFLDLHSKLKMGTPEIINRPFTYLSGVIEKIKDVEEYKMTDNYIQSFDFFKNRLDRNKEITNNAIEEYEKAEEFEIKFKIYEIFGNKKFAELDKLKQKVESDYKHFKPLLSQLYCTWGNEIINQAVQKLDDDIYQKSYEKFKIANELDENDFTTLHNLGYTLSELARIKSDLKLYEKSIEIYKKAYEINSNDDELLNKWGGSLYAMARISKDENLYKTSIEKFKEAIKINSNNKFAYYNWGNATYFLALLTSNPELFRESIDAFTRLINEESEDGIYLQNLAASKLELGKLESDTELIKDSAELFQSCILLMAENYFNYINLGVSLQYLGKITKELKYLESSIEKFVQAIEINSNSFEVYNSWSATLIELYLLNNDNKTLDEAFDKAQKAYDLDKNCSYNLACCFALKDDKILALKYLEEALMSENIPIPIVLKDIEWEKYVEDQDFKQLITKYNKAK